MKYKTTSAIIVNDANEILLIKRGREPFKDCWSLVGGIGESRKGRLPEEVICNEVLWDLGTKFLNSRFLFSVPVENDERTDEVLVFVGNVDESEIQTRPGYTDDHSWFSLEKIEEYKDTLAFENFEIIDRYRKGFVL